MTPLGHLLVRRIRATGPLTVAEYMAECLLHPTHGYYTTREPFGSGGDFTTAPEISQMFGELIGLCLAQSWLDQGAPAAITLAELGPGRGTLMADLLRATRAVPGFHAAARVTMVEASPRLGPFFRSDEMHNGLRALLGALTVAGLMAGLNPAARLEAASNAEAPDVTSTAATAAPSPPTRPCARSGLCAA